MRSRQFLFRFGQLPVKMAAVIGVATAFVCAVVFPVSRQSRAQESPEQLTSTAAVTRELLTLLPDDSSQESGLSSSPDSAVVPVNPAPQGAAEDALDSDTPFERIAPAQQPACAAMTAKESPWCRFRPGSWIRRR